MASWRNFFKPWILARGQEYHEFGQVGELKEIGSTVFAEVSGSKTYHVEIQRKDHRVVHMSCDCPYAVKGENCKHMAAVLFSIDEKTPQPRMDWQTALAQMSEGQLRMLLHSMISKDRTFQDRIVRMVSGPGEDPALWQAELEQIISDYKDYDDSIGYDDAYDCMMELAEYLEECLPPLLIGGQLEAAANLTMTVYDTAWGQDTDDSDGGLSVVSEHCREAIAKILSLADAQQERKIFDLLHEFLKDSNWIYGSDDFEQLLLSLEWSPKLQQANLCYLDNNLNSWRMRQRAELMEQMGASKSEIIAWWEQFRDLDDAYRPLLALYEEDLPKAIELVREHRKNAKNTPWQIVDDTKCLLDLLEKAGDQTEYNAELQHLVLKLQCQELEYVSRLKTITPPKQWLSVFATLLANAKLPVERMRLYHLDGLYDELVAELRRYPNIMTFRSFEEDLRKQNPAQALKLHIDILKREMEIACDRNQYRRVVSYIDRLDTYPNGEVERKQLVVYWYVHHYNRPAMKDELSKAGYLQE